MASPTRQLKITETIDRIGKDLLQNIFSRLPALSFASVACVSRFWDFNCNQVLRRPKLSSACSFNSSLHVAVEEVINKVLSEPIRPHFAIASIGPSFDLQEAHELITAKLGSKVPIVTNRSSGVIGKDVYSDDFIEWNFIEKDYDPNAPLHVRERANRAFMLMVGFLPGMKIKIISLQGDVEDPESLMMDKFISDIREFSTSVSGCESPASIIMFCEMAPDMTTVIENIDHAMSPETIIVGNSGYKYRHTSGKPSNITDNEEHLSAAVALVFAMDKDKPPGIGETQFHAVLSSGLLPTGPEYKIESAQPVFNFMTKLTEIRREASGEKVDGVAILNHVYNKLGDSNGCIPLYMGVTKRRKCSDVVNEKATYLSFHYVPRTNGCILVSDIGITPGDVFRFYLPDSTTALSSAANISKHLRSYKRERITNNDKRREVFGGLLFSSSGRDKSFSGQLNADSSLFLDNFPGLTLGGSFCNQFSGSLYRWEYGHDDSTRYIKESQEQRSVRCCLHKHCALSI